MKKLLIVLGLLICAACAQKATLKPNEVQAEHLLRLQVEAREAFQQAMLQQQEYLKKLKLLQDACDEVAKTNKWPAETTCTAKTGAQAQDLLVTPVTFNIPEKPKEAKK